VLAALSLASGLVGLAPAGVPPAAGATTAAATTRARAGLPPGTPPAARRPAATLPTADRWPFPERFPRTSGTGRYAGGALLWTDFLYDDNGAASGPSTGESPGAFSFGTYEYPEPEQAGNGADVFRAAVAWDGQATWWRVDWNTLVEPAVPAAAFGIDLDASGGGTAPWGANTGLSSAGLDHTLLVTAAGAFLDGERVADTVVDSPMKSFVVRLDSAVLRPSGTSTVWLAAGLADDDGEAFASLGEEHRHAAGQPNVYNVAFRDYADEPAANNFWFDLTQAQTLSRPGADVSDFALTVDWEDLADRRNEPEPFVRGWSNRWYVSSVELGDGVVTGLESSVDREPNYLGRVQPYGVYVPTGYRRDRPARLTWLLHSLTINHNQFSATAPTLIAQACEQRESICATTLGRGPDGYYRGAAELDFWEVWRELAATYTLDRDRTLVGGYSMGGFGTFNVALDHPHLFAGMFILAASADEDLSRLENARWTPYYHAHGVHDQLVPYAGEAVPTVDELDRLGYRYRFDTYPTKDHVAWSLEDGFDLATAWMAEADRVRKRRPGVIRYRWFPAEADRRLGIGPRGAWWFRAVAKDGSAAEARVVARSLARPERPVSPQRSQIGMVDPNGAPVERRELGWDLGARPDARPRVVLRLRNVGRLRLDVTGAGLGGAVSSRIVVRTDHAMSLRLVRRPPHTLVFLDGKQVNPRRIVVPIGRHRISIVR
jgi:pimeloyl-ACP methyl ester carboxylesterase